MIGVRLPRAIHRIPVRTRRTLKLADLEAVKELEVTAETYVGLNYERTQEISSAVMWIS
jgi:hypothetical protein